MSRKSVLENPEIKQKLKEAILEFDEALNVNAKVSYKDIYEYIKILFEQGKIDFDYPSYTWWKTSGKFLVDEYNKVKRRTIRVSEREELDYPDIKDLIDKYGGGNKNILWENLQSFDIYIERLVGKNQKLEETNEKLESELRDIKEKQKKTMSINNKLQQLLFAIFTYSKKSETEFVNMLNTGEYRNEIVKLSISNTFGSPKAFINELTRNIKKEYFKKIDLKVDNDEDNIVQFPSGNIKSMTESSEEQDYDW